MPRRGPLAFLKVEPPRKCTQHEADGVCGVVIFFTKSFWTDIALRISLSSVLLGLSLWASLFAFARPQYTSGRDRPNRLQARHGAFMGDWSQVPYAKVLTPDKVRLDGMRPNVLCVASVEKSERPEDPSGLSAHSHS